jgi:hypothetical protein
MTEPAIAEIRVERLDPRLLLTPENFRPSHVPIRLVFLRKRIDPGHD